MADADSAVEPTRPERAEYLGQAAPAMEAFAELLERHGVERGLIGPREVPRLWSRHLLNCAALVPFLPQVGTVIDLGSGAGLPGIVVAAMRPQLMVELIEPMERRTIWLLEVAGALGLTNVTVTRGRAEEFAAARAVDVVTARAVAPLDKLARWSTPLLRPGGYLLAIKGQRAADEVAAHRRALAKAGLVQPTVLTARTLPTTPATHLVRAQARRSVR